MELLFIYNVLKNGLNEKAICILFSVEYSDSVKVHIENTPTISWFWF